MPPVNKRLSLAKRFPDAAAILRNDDIVQGARVVVTLQAWGTNGMPYLFAVKAVVCSVCTNNEIKTVSYNMKPYANFSRTAFVSCGPAPHENLERAAIQILRRFLMPILEKLRWDPNGRLFERSGFVENGQKQMETLACSN